jgi:hypothetical protein
MKKFVLVFIIVVCTVFAVHAQTKNITQLDQLWLAYNNQTRLSDKWGLWGDFHLRTRDHLFTDLSATIARVGIMYYLNDVTKVTAGYAYVTNYPIEGTLRVNQPEHRPWQQIQWNTKNAKTRMMQWIRLEERYRKNITNDSTLGTGYNFNFRLRYNFWYEIPFSLQPTPASKWSFVINDELHINFGKQIVYNYFDQNRLFVGFKYNTSKTDNVQFGYMNQFIQLGAGNRYRNIDAARIFYFHNLDLRTRK